MILPVALILPRDTVPLLVVPALATARTPPPCALATFESVVMTALPRLTLPPIADGEPKVNCVAVGGGPTCPAVAGVNWYPAMTLRVPPLPLFDEVVLDRSMFRGTVALMLPSASMARFLPTNTRLLLRLTSPNELAIVPPEVGQFITRGLPLMIPGLVAPSSSKLHVFRVTALLPVTTTF